MLASEALKVAGANVPFLFEFVLVELERVGATLASSSQCRSQPWCPAVEGSVEVEGKMGLNAVSAAAVAAAAAAVAAPQKNEK